MLAQVSESALVNEVLGHPDLIPLVAIAGGLAVGAIAILCGTITSAMKVKAREATKRELAAYVAEGSIDPDKAVELLKAGEFDLEDVLS